MRSVAGDIYDFAVGDTGVGILVADVTGHGVPAALIASMAKIAFTSQAGCAGQPSELLGESLAKAARNHVGSVINVRVLEQGAVAELAWVRSGVRRAQLRE